MHRLIVISVLIAALHAPTTNTENSGKIQVLFVGNSLTFYNDMPAMVAALYKAHRPASRVHAKLVTQPGASVADHLSEKEFRNTLEKGAFDIVVVQEIGGWPQCPDDFKGCQGSVPALKEVFALTRAVQAKPIWYSTWQANALLDQPLEAGRELTNYRSSNHKAEGCPMPPGRVMRQIVEAANGSRATR